MGPADHAWVLALNAAHVVETGPLDARGLADAVAEASLAAVAEQEAGFLLAYAQGARLGSPNFQWFAVRMDDFLYVDRVIVAAAARGRGIGAVLYGEAAVMARRLGLGALVAEVNIEPANPGSLAFHARLGFRAVGEAHLAGRGKTVRYLRRDLG